MRSCYFSIVCDSGCDLPAPLLEGLGVVSVVVGREDDDNRAQRLAEAYRALAEQGYTSVISVHSSSEFSRAIDDARLAGAQVADEVSVEVLDTGVASVGTGMVVERLASWRAQGADGPSALAAAHVLAKSVRLLVVPTATARLSRRRTRHHHASSLGLTASTLRMKISGERALFLLSRGSLTALARATNLVELTSRLVHAMSAVAATEGALVYTLLETGDPRAVRAVEKPLDTNEFVSRCLGTVHANESVVETIGSGAVGVAFMPAHVYTAAFSELALLGSDLATAADDEALSDKHRVLPQRAKKARTEGPKPSKSASSSQSEDQPRRNS